MMTLLCAPEAVAIGAGHICPPREPVISVVLPTCNRLGLLRTTVASVMAQTFTQWELVIADDGSESETRAYLAELARDPRVRVEWLPHSGKPAVVRNAGLLAARGEYVAFLDSDDVWAEDKLARQLEILRTNPGCRWSYTGFRAIDALGREIDDQHGRFVPPACPIFDALLNGPLPVRAPSVVLASRQLLTQAGGFDPTLASAEDSDLWMRLALLSDVVLLNEPLVQVRLHAQNHSRHWDIAYAGREMSLWNLERRVDPDRRRLLRRERARNALKLASAHAAERNSGRMWQALLASAPYSWTCPSWWRGLVQLPLQAHLPPQLLARKPAGDDSAGRSHSPVSNAHPSSHPTSHATGHPLSGEASSPPSNVASVAGSASAFTAAHSSRSSGSRSASA